MLALKKVHYALQNPSYKSTTKRTKATSIPLLQIPYLKGTADSRARAVPVPTLPAEIWFMVLESLEYPKCLLCNHTLLRTLSLVCRVFNEFGTKALYQTLVLRFSGECKESHQELGKFHWYSKPHITIAFLRRKLDRLQRTLRLPQGPVLLVRHLKLPEIDITRFPSYAQNIIDILPSWVTVLELCSNRLESISGLGNLWSYLHHFNLHDLRKRLCDAIANSPHWTQWDWRSGCWGYAWWNVLAEEPRILQIYRGWKNIRHVSLDTATWAASVLSLPEIRSLSIECGDRMSDFRTMFQHVPITGLKSLTINAWVPPQEAPTEYDNTEPLNPFIDYLSRCRPQSASSQYLNSSTLTNLDISCLWTEGNHFSPGYHYPKMVCFDEFLFSIFTLAPMLRNLKIVLKTPHEKEIKLLVDHAFDNMAHQTTDFVAQHLRSMEISIPSRNSKIWLAAKIASGAFPKLSSFVFRSAMTRRDLGCRTMFCNCTQDSAEEFLDLNDFGRQQDAALVEACQEAGVREWEMQILHINSVWSVI